MSTRPENSGRKQAGRFAKGESGNPTGKPKGARHKATMLAEKLMHDDAESVVAAVIEAAKGGDMTAARIVLDRISPARKSRPVAIELPAIETTGDLLAGISVVIAAMAAGEITPEEAATISGILDAKRRALESTELEARIAALENAKGKSL